jgi:hypothetical protein
MPLGIHEIDTTVPFTPPERLYRRISPLELDELGEITPDQFESISFKKEQESAPSVLRERFSVPADALHRDCADGKDFSSWRVFAITVGQLPTAVTSMDGRVFDFFPVHIPLQVCGAHSVISSCLASDTARKYICPPRNVRNDLRTKLAIGFRPA